MESIKKLRYYAKTICCIDGDNINRLADEIEREIAERYMELPLDAGELTADYAASGEVCDLMYNGIIELLDRQAAITKRECVRHQESLAQRMIRDGYEYEIWELEKRVKELNAKLGGGECEMLRYRNVLGPIDEWQCSECEADVKGLADDTPPNFCPNCGRKAVKR